jgi:8-oxo-dGTP diphosphatase
MNELKEVCLVLCVKDIGAFMTVLLARHTRGPGAGLINGYGGKLKEGETPEMATIRELGKESGLSAKVEDLEKCALIDFFFNGVHSFHCHVFILREWEGVYIDSDEMVDPHFHFVSRLPKDMWPADHEWMPIVFDGLKIKARVDYRTVGGKLSNDYMFGYSAVTLL